MRMWRVSPPVSVAPETVIRVAADATHSARDSKILLLGVFATLLVATALVAVAAFPMIIRTDVPPVPAKSTLKCYDSAGKYQPCLAPAVAAQSRSTGRTTGQLASWTTTALYQVDDHPANWTTSPPIARRSTTSGKHPATGRCGRHLIPCFFSAMARGLTHIASVAGTVGQARPAKERL
jgi:hypothetical protein